MTWDPSRRAATARQLNPGLTWVLRLALYAVAAVSLASALATYREVGAFDRLVGLEPVDALADLARAEGLSAGLGRVAFWVGAAAGGITILWWYRAYQAIEQRGFPGLRWSRRWAIGAWFIPLANVVLPKLVLNEIDRISQAEVGEEWLDRGLTLLPRVWWGSWVAGLVLTVVGATVTTGELLASSFDPVTYRTGLVITAVGFAASMAAGFLGAASVRVIGSRLHP